MLIYINAPNENKLNLHQTREVQKFTVDVVYSLYYIRI